MKSRRGNEHPILKLIDAPEDGILVIDENCQIIECNVLGREIMQAASSNDAENQSFLNENRLSLIKQVFADGIPVKGELFIKGPKIYSACYLPVFREQKVVSVIAWYQDITTKEKLGEELGTELELALEKVRELEAVFEHSHDGIWVMNGEGVTLRVNKSWEEFSGIKREEVIGKTVYEIVDKGYYSDSAAIHVLATKKPSTIIYETSTGQKALVTGVPIFTGDGKIWRIVSNVRDITELDILRKELEKTRNIADHYQKELRLIQEINGDSGSLIVRSECMRKLLNKIQLAARSESTVLILGETGVGKEVLARLIHDLSSRQKGPFIKINCGGIPSTLLESELFGFEEGSFTGARKRGKMGMFELANKGTLFLDEIGEMPLELQPKLLHALQDHQIMRVGGTNPIKLDVRIIAATNRDLAKMVAENRFRKDLFYRINIIPLYVPPLRERREDIIPLAFHFLRQFNQKYNLTKRFSADFIKGLLAYDWPGNVRELENLIERMVVMTPGEQIELEHLDSGMQKNEKPKSLKKAVEHFEKELILQALKEYGSTHKAARALGITQPTVVRKAHKYGIKTEELKQKEQ